MCEFRAIKDKSQLVDALTGASLGMEASECFHCGVFYNEESLHAIAEHNEGKCVSCFQVFKAINQ